MNDDDDDVVHYILIVESSIFCLNKQIFGNILLVSHIQYQIGIGRFKATDSFIVLIQSICYVGKAGGCL